MYFSSFSCTVKFFLRILPHAVITPPTLHKYFWKICVIIVQVNTELTLCGPLSDHARLGRSRLNFTVFITSGLEVWPFRSGSFAYFLDWNDQKVGKRSRPERVTSEIKAGKTISTGPVLAWVENQCPPLFSFFLAQFTISEGSILPLLRAAFCINLAYFLQPLFAILGKCSWTDLGFSYP